MIKDIKYAKYYIDNECEGKIIKISGEFTAITGYTWNDIKENKMSILDLIPQEYRDEYEKILYEAISVGEAYLSHTIKCKNGEIISVNCFGEVYKDEDTNHFCSKIFIIDVTAQEKAVEELTKKEEQLALQIEKIKFLTENTKEIFLDYDIQQDYIEISRFINGEYDVFFVKENYLQYDEKRIFNEDFLKFKDEFLNRKSVNNKFAFDFRSTIFSKEYRWYRLIYAKYLHPKTGKDHLIGRIMDINEEKLAALSVNENIESDELTGVYIKKNAEKKIDEIISASVQKTKHTMLLVDIDGMQDINSVYGRECGDKVLVGVSELLCDMFRQNFDIIARVDGDAFIVFIRNTKEINYVEERCNEICERTKNEVSRKIFTDGRVVTVSIGVSVTDEKANSYKRIYKKADKALQRQKENGKDGFDF